MYTGLMDKQGFDRDALMTNRFKCLKSKMEKLLYTIYKLFKLKKIPNMFDNRHMTVNNYIKMCAKKSTNAKKWTKISWRELNGPSHRKKFERAPEDLLTKWNVFKKCPGAEGILLERGFDKGMQTRVYNVALRFILFHDAKITSFFLFVTCQIVKSWIH